MLLYSQEIETPLGHMIALADESELFLLEFLDVKKQLMRSRDEIVESESNPLLSIKNDLHDYFKGTLKEFRTPLNIRGTYFQKQVWQKLQLIPYGQTWSYKTLAEAIEKPTACRAVAQANGANRFSIVIPCHRVINANKALGGYAGGLDRKKWLLKHELQFSSQ